VFIHQCHKGKTYFPNLMKRDLKLSTSGKGKEKGPDFRPGLSVITV
jgi:hypothetical protein